MELYYDFHIHSCLSPCGDADMTPNNIVNMALLQGMEVIALTDHNSCGNCAAAMQVGEEAGLLVLPGMELETEEEAHVLCLFAELPAATAFWEYVRAHQFPMENREEIYGEQLYMNALDEVTGKEKQLLLTATDIGAFDVAKLVKQYEGIAIPAHVDKSSYSLIASLGFLTPDMGFHRVELSASAPENYLSGRPDLTGMQIQQDSDAHYLWQLPMAANKLTVSARTPKAILEALSAGSPL